MPVAVVFLLRIVVLVLLWGFVIATVVAVRHDVFGTRPRRLRSAPTPSAPPARPAAPAPAPAAAKPRRGAKATPAVPTRVVIVEGTGAGATVSLSSLPVTIGRANDSTIVISDDYASSNHARLVPHGGAWQLEDLGSTNGTVLNGKKLTTPTVVPVGARITIGRTVLELQ